MKYLCSMVAVAVLGVHGSGIALAQTDYTHNSDRTQYTFGARHHVDTLADRLRREANTVCWEMHDNYQHERGFRETYREMYSVLQDAIHIHDLAHDDVHGRTNNEDHIAQDLHDMDKLFHHIEEDIEHWSSRNRYHSHDLIYRMERLETTLHHLMKDYGVRSNQPAPKPSGPPTPPVPGQR
ncbi:MAG: hypothetical protein O3B13_05230 [Planctomycetota bacterium]|nr:hypothetical protein [Planctomycetota bacterium]MDA1162480.1 hypothetical protein [Planctomycetota bacterium]